MWQGQRSALASPRWHPQFYVAGIRLRIKALPVAFKQ